MKRLSMSMPAIALALVLFLSSATPAHNSTATSPSHPRAATPKNETRQIAYYWYTYPGDAFVDHQTVAVEELEYYIYFGWFVNTSPGGTLISRGYTTNNYPHSAPPSVYLFRH